MKVNKHYQQKLQQAFQQELSFQEWLDYFSKEPTTKELEEMQKQSKSTRKFYHPLNNTYYQPLQGA